MFIRYFCSLFSLPEALYFVLVSTCYLFYLCCSKDVYQSRFEVQTEVCPSKFDADSLVTNFDSDFMNESYTSKIIPFPSIFQGQVP
jgi:hypothetical protein